MRERNAGIIYCSYSHTGFQSDGAGSLESTLEDKNLGEPPEASMPLRDDIVVCRRDKDKLRARHAVPLQNEIRDSRCALQHDTPKTFIVYRRDPPRQIKVMFLGCVAGTARRAPTKRDS